MSDASYNDLIERIKGFGFFAFQMTYFDKAALDKKDFQSRFWRLPDENICLMGTPFYHKGNDFLHFTSIDAALNILASGKVRLYNLVKMEDKFELDFAQQQLRLSKISENDKENIFALSMCSTESFLNVDPMKMLKKHLLWKIHGNNGEGVALRFKFSNNPASWFCHYIAECKYGTEIFDHISMLNEITDKEKIDSLFGGFIKMPIYEFENEIRLLFDARHSITSKSSRGEILYPIIKESPAEKKPSAKYYEIPVVKSNNTGAPKLMNALKNNFQVPQIIVSEIIVGYKISLS